MPTDPPNESDSELDLDGELEFAEIEIAKIDDDIERVRDAYPARLYEDPEDPRSRSFVHGSVFGGFVVTLAYLVIVIFLGEPGDAAFVGEPKEIVEHSGPAQRTIIRVAPRSEWELRLDAAAADLEVAKELEMQGKFDEARDKANQVVSEIVVVSTSTKAAPTARAAELLEGEAMDLLDAIGARLPQSKHSMVPSTLE